MLTETLLRNTIKQIEENNQLGEGDKWLLIDTYNKELKVIEKVRCNMICNLDEVEERIKDCNIYLINPENIMQ